MTLSASRVHARVRRLHRQPGHPISYRTSAVAFSPDCTLAPFDALN